MTTHNLQLATEPFNAIISGQKTIESRLYDEKRQSIQLGDKLIFTNREQPDQTVEVTVLGLLRYEPSMTSLLITNLRNSVAHLLSGLKTRLMNSIASMSRKRMVSSVLNLPSRTNS